MADYYLSQFKVSSQFGEKRGSEVHNGVDFAGLTPGAADGMAIPALVGGTVEQVFVNNKSAGHGVVIRGDDGRQYRYIHMKYAPKVKKGQKIMVGQSIGQVGSTGQSTGPHLDLKVVDKNGKYVDPMKILNAISSTAEDLPKEKKSNSEIVGYANYWKTSKEATKADGYSTYKNSLSSALRQSGISDSEWETWARGVTEIIGRESTWNTSAKNGKHTGYGQFTPENVKAYEKKLGIKYDTPENQIRFVIAYIKDRYGDPVKALQHHDRKNWY